MMPVQLPSRPASRLGGTSSRSEAVRDQQVEAHEYLELVLSNRRLLRDDDRRRQLLRLVDPAAGVRYVISEQKLFER